jgi:pantoate--beta-alanine ligase
MKLLRPLRSGLPTTTRFFTTSTPLSACKPAQSKDTIPNTRIKIFREVEPLRIWRKSQMHSHRSVGLVPTMGALHAGHLALIKQAAAENSSVVVSIYVNPAQFGVSEDLDSYPKTFDSDCTLLKKLDLELAEDGAALGGIAAVFAPTTQTMYPSGFPGQAIEADGSFVTITPLARKLEGSQRPTFFRGVATVCMKLFNIVAPERVYFGQKDVQQTVIIKRMVKDFIMDTEVRIGDTVRESDGLAMSSRNVYLGERRRKNATVLSKALKAAEAAYAEGGRARAEILGPAEGLVEAMEKEQMSLQPSERIKWEVGYISLADPETLDELDVVDPSRGAILSGAIKMLPVEEPKEGEYLGQAGGPAVRLIDNIILKPVTA